MLKVAGGSSVSAALAGCAELIGGGGGDGGAGTGGTGQVPDEPISAGLQTFTEGAAAVLGKNAEFGAKTAVRRINNADGVAGRQIEMDVVNEGDGQAENYNRFVEEGKDVTFGPISSGGHSAMVPEIEDKGVVNVSTDGTVTTLYEEQFPDVTYSFRFQNHDVMEATSAAVTAVEQLGADNIDTFANINPNYAFGQDEREIFNAAIQKLTGAEEVYSGFPELATDDMSTHVTSVVQEEPDVLFSSCWGGDATLLLEQGQASDMPDATEIIVGPVFYGSANDLEESLIQGNIWAGSRNFYWGFPDPGKWQPGIDLFEESREEHGAIPSAHFMSGYGAVAAWATAAEKAVDIVGGWPSQEQIAATLEEHGFYTPAGYHVIGPDHQGYSTSHFGRLEWSSDISGPILEEVVASDPRQVSPPQGDISLDWIEGWDL